MRENAASQLPVQQRVVLLILCILCIDVQSVDGRINGTGSLLPIGHEKKPKEIHSYSCLFVFIRGLSLFSDRPFFLLMIRPVVGGGGAAC